MSGNWDDEEDEEVSSAPVRLVPKSKWDDEEDSDVPVLDSWDASSDDEKAKPVAAPPKKSLKEKIAEREAAAQKLVEENLKKLALERTETPAERRERLRKMQIQSDLDNAADLFSGVVSSSAAAAKKDDSDESEDDESEDDSDSTGPPAKAVQLEDLEVMNPKTKAEFEVLSSRLSSALVGLAGNPTFATIFLPQFIKSLVAPLNSEQVRKCASTLTTVMNEKIKEEKAADKPKKEKKAKPGLAAASAKIDDSVDTTNYSRYDEVDDFM